MSFKDEAIAIILLVCACILGAITVFLILRELILNRAIIYLFMGGTVAALWLLGKKYWKRAKRKKRKS